MDSLDEEYLRDTFRLLSGLNIEQHRLDLPGRLFHKLMNHDIRKLLAAFYTRPIAAELLARLAISSSGDTVIDPACGSGTILVQAYKRKEELAKQEALHGSQHVQFCENDIWGSEIMPFGVHLTTANLASLEPQTELHQTRISQGDSLNTLQDKLNDKEEKLSLEDAKSEIQEVNEQITF